MTAAVPATVQKSKLPSLPIANSMLVSVITPVGPKWNSEYLKEAAESLKTSGLPYEWLVAADGANMEELAETVMEVSGIRDDSSKKLIKVKVVGSEHNQGIAYARNAALSEAQGDWVYAFDADDISLEGINKLYNATYREKTVWSAGLAYDVDATGKNIIYTPKPHFAPFTKTIPLNGFISTADDTGVYPFLCSGATFLNTEEVRRFGGWDEALMNVSEDVSLLARISATHVGAWTEQTVLAYRKHGDSITYDSKPLRIELAAWNHVRANLGIKRIIKPLTFM